MTEEPSGLLMIEVDRLSESENKRKLKFEVGKLVEVAAPRIPSRGITRGEKLNVKVID